MREVFDENLTNVIEEDMLNDHSLDEIKKNLVAQGLSDKEINRHLDTSYNNFLSASKSKYTRLNSLFSIKEVFDRLGYGFAAHQFITILFFISGAGPFLVGIVNGLRDIFSSVASAFIQEYSEVKTFGKNTISTAGMVFGFSFLIIALAMRLRSLLLFSVALIIGSVGIVVYGELYNRLLEEDIQHEKRSRFLRQVVQYGLVITAIAFVISGLILQTMGTADKTLVFGSFTVPVSGYFIIFELAAILFVLSGFILSKIPLKVRKARHYDVWQFTKEYFHQMMAQMKLFFKNKYTTLLFVGAILVSVIESLGASYYGYVIYQLFKNQLFGGFLNVTIVFGFAIIMSFAGPIFTKFFQQKIGLAPMFVFGSLLIAMMPLVLIFNQYFYAVVAAATFTILGSGILGVAQSMLAHKLLFEHERKVFFQSLGMFITLPFIVLVPLGAYIAQSFGFIALFKVIAITLLFVVAPLYFVLVIISNKRRL